MHYIPQLDGLRALAAIAVVAFHAGAPGAVGGFLGVDIFFVLSGYLITSLLVDEQQRSNRIDYRRFVIRRFWRLYPALLLLLAAYALIGPWLFPQYGTAKHYQDIVLAALYLSDYARTFDMPLSVLNHTWSLSVEMHFYLAWPVVLALVLKLPKAGVQVALLFLWLAATAWRMFGFHWLEDGWDIYNRADTHSSGLILGALVSTFKPMRSQLIGLAGLALVLLAVTSFHWRTPSTALLGFSLAEVGTAMILMSPAAWMGSGPLVWIGKMSYGLYLWHYPVIRAMRDIDASWQASLAAGLSIGLLLAAASYYLVEQQILKRRDRGTQGGTRQPRNGPTNERRRKVR